MINKARLYGSEKQPIGRTQLLMRYDEYFTTIKRRLRVWGYLEHCVLYWEAISNWREHRLHGAEYTGAAGVCVCWLNVATIRRWRCKCPASLLWSLPNESRRSIGQLHRGPWLHPREVATPRGALQLSGLRGTGQRPVSLWSVQVDGRCVVLIARSLHHASSLDPC